MMKLVFASCMVALATAAPSLRASENIVQIAEKVPELSILVKAVEAAGLVSTLEGPGPFTVLAPTDRAFAELGEEALKFLLDPKNKADLVKVLTYHVVPGAVNSSALKDDEKIKTVEGEDITCFIHDDHVFFAWEEPRNFALVIKADVQASNGVIHIIDHVLLPGRGPAPQPKPNSTIADIAVATPELSTLVTALKAANLVETLNGEGPFTVFAPTNEAFAHIPPENLKKLLNDTAVLTKVLLYHVIKADIQAKDLYNDDRLTTVEGKHILVKVFRERTGVAVILQGDLRQSDEARITKVDIEASNGVIHLIDHVLAPEDI
jgi:transforming growth factor-beta-induced protein